MAGWIKLHRALKESSCFKNEKLLKVWIWCLLKATHKKREKPVGRQIITLCPGQFDTGRYKAAEELDMKPSTVWEYLLLLKDRQSIDIKSNTKFSIITVLNWELYQSDEEESDNKPDNKTTTKQQQNNSKSTHNKNDKNVKNEKNNIFIPPSLEEVKKYCLERKNGVDPQKWINHYQAKGWMIGKNKMKDWKAAVRTWEQNQPKPTVDKPSKYDDIYL